MNISRPKWRGAIGFALIGILLGASVLADDKRSLTLGGVHGGGGSDYVGNFIRAAGEEIDQTLIHVPSGPAYRAVLRETLESLDSIRLVDELLDSTGNPVTQRGLHAYSWPGVIQLLKEYWQPRLVEVVSARHNRVEIIHELFRAVTPRPGLDTNDEGYRITIQVMKLDQRLVERDGRKYRIWPNGGGLVDIHAKVDPSVYVDVDSVISGDVNVAEKCSLVSSHLNALNGKQLSLGNTSTLTWSNLTARDGPLTIASRNNFSSGYVTSIGGDLTLGSGVTINSGTLEAHGTVAMDSLVKSGSFSGYIHGGSFRIINSSCEGVLKSGGEIEISSSGCKGDMNLGYKSRVTSSAFNGTISLGDYTSFQNSSFKGLRLDAGRNSLMYDVVIDTKEGVTLDDSVRLDNVSINGNASFGPLSSVIQSQLSGDVIVAGEIAICRMQLKDQTVNKSLCR